MQNYNTTMFEQDGDTILISGIVNFTSLYIIINLFRERTNNKIWLPIAIGTKSFNQETDYGNVCCSFDIIEGYSPYENFYGRISEKDFEFNIIQTGNDLKFGRNTFKFEFLGTKTKLEEVFSKLQMAL